MSDARDELMARIRLGEDNQLELTAVTWAGDRVRGPGRDELADELAAMANSADGVLLLGVDDKRREILGVPLALLDTAEAYVRELCNDSIKPPLRVHILRMELPDANGTPRAILKIDVPRSLFVHKGPGG